LEKAKTEKEAHGEFESECPGYCGAQDTFEEPSDANLETACAALGAGRPTAVNLQWALEAMRRHLLTLPPAERGRAGFAYADAIAEQDVSLCQAIGAHGPIACISTRSDIVDLEGDNIAATQLLLSIANQMHVLDRAQELEVKYADAGVRCEA
jgi:methylthioribose-1-phosphate isomerase